MTRLILIAALLAPLAAQAEHRSHYRVDLSQRAQQIVNVEVRFEDHPGGALDLHLPTWRTGLYRQLDPVGTLSELRVTAGDAELAVTRSAGSSWRVDAPAGEVVVSYRIYANSLADRTRHVDADHALLNPAAVFLYADSYRHHPLTVRLDLPEDWEVASGLEFRRGRADYLVAPDYDRLVDSPIEAGSFDLVEFTVRGARIQVAVHGTWDRDERRLVNDLTRLIETTADVFDGVLPFERYLFIVHSMEGLRGGTEYFNSTLMHTDPAVWWQEDEFRKFLGLAAHEFIHTWNVKRFRPAGIAEYDYQDGNLSELLWFAEGVTSYYDDILPVRAGLVERDDYRKLLAERIAEVIDRPGYGSESLVEASLEAWTHGFRSDADRAPDKPNSTVSFYSQGGVLGLVLDLRIRELTGGASDLDDLLLALYRDYPLGSAGYTVAGVRSRLVDLAGPEIGQLFDRVVVGTEPLPIDAALATVGWTLRRKAPEGSDRSMDLGIESHAVDGLAVVTVVLRDGPAWAAGLNAGDALVALDGVRVGAEGPADLMHRYREGERATLSFFRADQLREVEVILRPALTDWEIVVDEDADPATDLVRSAWLSGD